MHTMVKYNAIDISGIPKSHKITSLFGKVLIFLITAVNLSWEIFSAKMFFN